MIRFTNQDWDRVKKSFDDWWDKKSECAIIGAKIKRFAPDVKTPTKPLICQQNVHLNFTADEVLDSIEYHLSQYEFIGDTFPRFNMDCFCWI